MNHCNIVERTRYHFSTDIVMVDVLNEMSINLSITLYYSMGYYSMESRQVK
jgi:hypothetical protein